jgi:hypothetical protein
MPASIVAFHSQDRGVNMSTKVNNLSSKFAKVRKEIRRGDPEVSIELLNDLQAQIIIKLDGMKRAIEIGNRKCAPLEDRGLDVEYVDSNSSKLTINANTGRVSLKISNKSSDTVAEELKEFAVLHHKMLLPPLTFRGRIYWNKGQECYSCVLQSTNKHHTFNIQSAKAVEGA